jgi:MSHA biogenesis protein MshL
VQDGNIVAIGGLMRQESTTDRSQLPGLGDAPGVGSLFRQRGTSNTKSELVILLKPTIVHSDRVWQQELTETRDRIRAMEHPQPQPPAQ